MEVLGVLGIILLVLLFFALMAYAVAAYVLGSKGLYAIAARRGIKNPWMAWIPVVGNWTLGCVSDQYHERKYGQDPKLRKKLLILSIICQSGISAFPTVGNFEMNFSVNGDMTSEIMQTEAGRIFMIVFLVIMVPILIAALALSIIQTVYQYKAYYGLYASSKPQMAIAFLLLSIFTPAGPFLVFACRNDDAGLPPEPQE